MPACKKLSNAQNLPTPFSNLSHLTNHQQFVTIITSFYHLSPMGRNLFRYLYDFFCVFYR